MELLADIAKLLKKHGADSFDGLARRLADPNFAARLATVLSTTARVSRAEAAAGTRAPRSKQPRRDFRSTLEDLERIEPDKAALLLELHDGLRAKRYLPTIRQIRDFAADIGVQPPSATTRDKAIVPLVKALIPLSVETLRNKLAPVTMASSDEDRSLLGWSNLILSRDRSSLGDDG
jgi:hypothetical protein